MDGLQPIKYVADHVVHLHESRFRTASAKLEHMCVQESAWASIEEVDLAVSPDWFFFPGNPNCCSPRLCPLPLEWILGPDNQMINRGNELRRVSPFAVGLNRGRIENKLVTGTRQCDEEQAFLLLIVPCLHCL